MLDVEKSQKRKGKKFVLELTMQCKDMLNVPHILQDSQSKVQQSAWSQSSHMVLYWNNHKTCDSPDHIQNLYSSVQKFFNIIFQK